MIIKNGLLALTAASTLAVSQASADSQLNFGHAMPESDTSSSLLIMPWLETIEAETAGGISTNFLGSGSVVTFPAALTALQDGLIEGTMVLALFFRKELPANALLIDVGSTFTDRWASTMALNEMALRDCEECQAELSDSNAQVVATYVSLPYQLLCREPVATPEEMAGKRIRATGLQAGIITALGATPVNVGFTEIYESLQRGVIDCALADPSWLELQSLKEVVNYVLQVDVVVNPAPTVLTLREDYWESLSEDEQKVVFENLAAPLADWILFDEESYAQVIADTAGEIEYVDAPQWVVDAIDSASESIIQEAIAVAENSGVESAATIAEAYQASYAKWQQELEGLEVNEALLAELLRDNFYSAMLPD